MKRLSNPGELTGKHIVQVVHDDEEFVIRCHDDTWFHAVAREMGGYNGVMRYDENVQVTTLQRCGIITDEEIAAEKQALITLLRKHGIPEEFK